MIKMSHLAIAWAYSNIIGPANSHTHTLPIHRCINGLSCLACFFSTGFADHVKSQLKQ